MNEGVVLPLLDRSMCVLANLMVLAVLERVGQGIDPKEGQGTKNTGRVYMSETNTIAPVSSCRNDIKTRATLGGVEHSNNMAITR